jgi:hypothetical protein
MFNNSGTNLLDFNLDQGKDLLNYNESIDDIVKPYLKLISEGTLIESMSNHNLSGKDKKSINGLENIENSFNRTLSDYSNTYKQFSEDLLNRNQSKKPIVDYLGKTVNANGSIIYVNNFGYYHWYSRDSWNDGNINSSCSTDTKSYSKELPGEFTVGADMNKGQPCGMAGKVIKNTDTDEQAWVDIKGYKHIFPEGTKMSTSCAEVNIIKISSSDYNLIPSGNSMSSTEECLALDVNPSLWKKLQDLNQQLKSQGTQLKNELSKLKLDNITANDEVQHQRQKIQNHILKIDDDKNNLLYNKRMLMQMSGEEEDASLRMTSNYYEYLMWILLMILIVSLTVKSSLGKEGGPISPIVYLISAIFLLIFVVFLYNKFKNLNISY